MSGRFNHKSHYKHRNQKWKNRPQSSNNREKPKEYRHMEQLKENEVGITEFLSDLEGFTGIMKARFSDFQVNEIDLEGNVAKLTSTEIPKDFVAKLEKVNYKDVVESPLELIPQAIWEDIKKLLEESEDRVVELDAETLSKEDRKSVHECVKQHFGNKIIASTKNDEKKVLEFKKTGKDGAEDKRVQWPADKGEYVHFILYKEMADTMEACMKIGDCLRISPQLFAYAGVKDKRAKTSQWISVRKVEPWKLIIKTKNLRNVKIGNIKFKDQPLKLGDLSGNKFRIALRNITASDELINESLEFVKKNGFINYYGLQRFGNDKEVPTFDIGIKLLQGKWEEAIKLILKPKKADDPDLDISKAKKVFSETGDAKKALEEFQKNKNTCVEAKILEGLSKNNDNDFVNALESIPRNMRLLYLHAFQSLIWNKIVSKRIKEFGVKPIEGDLVITCDNVKKDEDNEDDEIKCNQEVKALTAEELNQYTIFDIVLPLPGYDVVYPEYLKPAYKEILQQYDLTPEMPKQKVKTYTLSGKYRNILCQLKDLNWHFLRYNDPNYNLIQSDFEELKNELKPANIPNGEFKALVMEFSLTSSSYATMVIREIMKIDTATSNHAKLNNYFEKTTQKKISAVENHDKTEISEVTTENSLLGDKEKYEQFKNNILGKRPAEANQTDESKKQKVDDLTTIV